MVAVIAILVVLVVLLYKGQGVPVLLYHQVNDLSNVNLHMLEKHFKLIKKQNLITLTAAEVKQYTDEKKKLPKNSILITFDDGYYDNYLNVFPLLKKFNFKATFFINSAFIKEKVDRTTTTIIKDSDSGNREVIGRYYRGEDATSDQYMTWEEMREMQQSGLCDFQLHSHTHKLAFATLELRGFVENENFGGEALHVYNGKPKVGYPMLRTRGETTICKLIPRQEFLEEVKNQYEDKKGLKPKQRKKEVANFIKNYADAATIESSEDARARILKEIHKNQEELQKHLGKQPVAYAWPYGHKSAFGKDIIKGEHVSLFFTCKKGTNGRTINPEQIKRIELRKPTVKKIRLVLIINNNLILGKLYGWVS
jgi:peptidoglycan/xylan/chitin deacetylase (PgdA/CDA1 family)